MNEEKLHERMRKTVHKLSVLLVKEMKNLVNEEQITAEESFLHYINILRVFIVTDIFSSCGQDRDFTRGIIEQLCESIKKTFTECENEMEARARKNH